MSGVGTWTGEGMAAFAVRRATAIEAARSRSRSDKGQRIHQAITAWGGARSMLLVGAGQGWTPIDTLVERSASANVPQVIASDLHRISRVPWPYVVADGMRLPFPDGSFDVVLSNAVIEHVGGVQDQARFVLEQLRVARHVIITTPNRWFPMETHTKAMFKHWWPRWRNAQTHEYTRLLSKRELRALLPPGSRVTGRLWNSTFIALIGPTAPRG